MALRPGLQAAALRTGSRGVRKLVTTCLSLSLPCAPAWPSQPLGNQDRSRGRLVCCRHRHVGCLVKTAQLVQKVQSHVPLHLQHSNRLQYSKPPALHAHSLQSLAVFTSFCGAPSSSLGPLVPPAQLNWCGIQSLSPKRWGSSSCVQGVLQPISYDVIVSHSLLQLIFSDPQWCLPKRKRV